MLPGILQFSFLKKKIDYIIFIFTIPNNLFILALMCHTIQVLYCYCNTIQVLYHYSVFSSTICMPSIYSTHIIGPAPTACNEYVSNSQAVVAEFDTIMAIDKLYI